MTEETVRSDRMYSPEHLWLRVEAEGVRIGVTAYGQHELGDVVDVFLPSAGSEVRQGARLCEIESVKVAYELLSPVTGVVVAVNEGLSRAPETINADPYGEGWLVLVRAEAMRAVGNLLTAEAYEALVGRLQGT